MQQVSMKLVIKYKTCGSKSEKKNCTAGTSSSIFKQTLKGKNKNMLHHNPQQQKANDATNKKCRTTIIYSKAKQEKKGSK